MVHSYRMAVLVTNRWMPSATLRDEFDVKNKAAAGWAEVGRAVTSNEMRALVDDGISTYKPLDFAARSYSHELVAPAMAPRTDTSGAARFGPRFATSGNATFEFEAPEELKTFPLMIAVGRGGTDPPDAVDPVILTDAAGNKVFATTVKTNTGLHELSIPLPAAGRYTLTITDAKRGLTLHLPTGIPLITRGFVSTDLSPVMFFYVPKGVKKLAFYMPNAAAPVKFRDSKGALVVPEGRGVALIPVPEGQDGQIWSMQGLKSWSGITALSTPSVYSFSPQTLMYPRDLADEVAARLKPPSLP
jgi:hypothetical protein